MKDSPARQSSIVSADILRQLYEKGQESRRSLPDIPKCLPTVFSIDKQKSLEEIKSDIHRPPLFTTPIPKLEDRSLIFERVRACASGEVIVKSPIDHDGRYLSANNGKILNNNVSQQKRSPVKPVPKAYSLIDAAHDMSISSLGILRSESLGDQAAHDIAARATSAILRSNTEVPQIHAVAIRRSRVRTVPNLVRAPSRKVVPIVSRDKNPEVSVDSKARIIDASDHNKIANGKPTMPTTKAQIESEGHKKGPTGELSAEAKSEPPFKAQFKQLSKTKKHGPFAKARAESFVNGESSITKRQEADKQASQLNFSTIAKAMMPEVGHEGDETVLDVTIKRIKHKGPPMKVKLEPAKSKQAGVAIPEDKISSAPQLSKASKASSHQTKHDFVKDASARTKSGVQKGRDVKTVISANERNVSASLKNKSKDTQLAIASFKESSVAKKSNTQQKKIMSAKKVVTPPSIPHQLKSTDQNVIDRAAKESQGDTAKTAQSSAVPRSPRPKPPPERSSQAVRQANTDRVVNIQKAATIAGSHKISAPLKHSVLNDVRYKGVVSKSGLKIQKSLKEGSHAVLMKRTPTLKRQATGKFPIRRVNTTPKSVELKQTTALSKSSPLQMLRKDSGQVATKKKEAASSKRSLQEATTLYATRRQSLAGKRTQPPKRPGTEKKTQGQVSTPVKPKKDAIDQYEKLQSEVTIAEDRFGLGGSTKFGGSSDFVDDQEELNEYERNSTGHLSTQGISHPNVKEASIDRKGTSGISDSTRQSPFKKPFRMIKGNQQKKGTFGRSNYFQGQHKVLSDGRSSAVEKLAVPPTLASAVELNGPQRDTEGIVAPSRQDSKADDKRESVVQPTTTTVLSKESHRETDLEEGNNKQAREIFPVSAAMLDFSTTTIVGNIKESIPEKSGGLLSKDVEGKALTGVGRTWQNHPLQESCSDVFANATRKACQETASSPCAAVVRSLWQTTMHVVSQSHKDSCNKKISSICNRHFGAQKPLAMTDNVPLLKVKASEATLYAPNKLNVDVHTSMPAVKVENRGGGHSTGLFS